MNSSIRVNDLFDDLSSRLETCRRLVVALIQLKDNCVTCSHKQLNPRLETLLKDFFAENHNKDSEVEVHKNNKEEEEEEEEEERVGFHESNGRWFCDTCFAHFSHKHLIKRHVLCHSDKRFKCDLCEKKFSQKSLLRGHCLRSHSSVQRFCIQEEEFEPQMDLKMNANNAFECLYCRQEFRNRCSLKRHLKTHFKPFKCLNCEKKFAQKSNARDHFMRVHNQEEAVLEIPQNKTFECLWPGCGLMTSNEASLRRHSRIHSRKPFKCEICEKSFQIKSNLTVHQMATHSPQTTVPSVEMSKISNTSEEFSFDVISNEFCCSLCQKTFQTISSIRRHLLSHEIIKPLLCPHENCRMSFTQKSNFRNHFLRIHSKNEKNSISNQKKRIVLKRRQLKERLKCLDCVRSFTSKANLEVHKQRVHDLNNPLKCSFIGCETRFKQRAHLELHLKRHYKRFKCDFCDYSSAFESIFKVHVSRHTGIHVFKCDICHKSFDYLGSLSSHKQREHSIKEPLICEWPGCGNAYKSVAGLRKHSTLHTGEKKYLCSWPECGQRFRHLTSLKVHVTQHTLERPFKCLECERSFATKDYLREHKKRVHKK